MKNSIRRFSAFALCLLAGVVSHAQVTFGRFMDSVKDEITGGAQQTVNTVTAIIGIVAVIYVGINLPKYLKGHGDSDNALLKVAVGVIIACVLVAIFNNTLIMRS